MLQILKTRIALCSNVERSFVFIASGSLFLLTVSGCSDQPTVHPVRGHVTLPDGSPVSFGLIEFRNTEMKLNARARIQKDGSYRLTTFEESDGAVVGKHQAIVLQHVIAEVARPGAKHPGQKQALKQHRQHRIVDSQFSRYETSPLFFNVEAVDENVIDIKVF